MVAARKVLVVDDEPLVRTGCTRVLGEAGYDVITACSGHEGLNRAFGEPFDAVLVDLRLPDLDGLELVRALSMRRPKVAVIIITGYASVPSAVEALKLGATDYVEKPFTPRRITAAVSDALAEPRQRPAGRSHVGEVLDHALAASNGHEEVRVEASLVREVLRLAARDPSFGQQLLSEGSQVLSGFALSSPAQAAITSGNIAWIEKLCGELSLEERRWLEQRLQAEQW